MGPRGATGLTGPAGAVGPPSDPRLTAPTYHAELIAFGGVAVWRQVEEVDVVFDGTTAVVAAAWNSFGGRPFEVLAAPASTDEANVVYVQIIESSIGATGCQVQASAPFVGKVRLVIRESVTLADAGYMASGGAARLRQLAEVIATFDGSSAQLHVTWPDFGSKTFDVSLSAPVTDSVDAIAVQVVAASVTSIGCTLQANVPFAGLVHVTVKERLS